MATAILTILGGAVGIAGTLIARKFHPRYRLWDQWDKTIKRQNQLLKERDEALYRKDNDRLTRVLGALSGLRNEQTRILQRLGKVDN